MIVAASVSIDGDVLFLILLLMVAAVLVGVAAVWAVTFAGVQAGRAASGRTVHPRRRGPIAVVTVAASLSPLFWGMVPSYGIGPIPPLLTAGLVAVGGGFAVGYLGGSAEPGSEAARNPPPPAPPPPWSSP